MVNKAIVVNFPKSKSKRVLPDLDLRTIKRKALMPKAVVIKRVFTWMLIIVRWPVFLILYWLRLPVVFICNIVSIPMLFAWLFAWYAFPDKTVMVWGFGTISFLAFVIGWTYDFILMAISPQDMMRNL